MAPVVKPSGSPPPIAVRLRSTTWIRAGVSVSTRKTRSAVLMQSTEQPTLEARSGAAAGGAAGARLRSSYRFHTESVAKSALRHVPCGS
jgi:hypothetical protein